MDYFRKSSELCEIMAMSVAIENTLLTRSRLKDYHLETMKEFMVSYLNETFKEIVQNGSTTSEVLEIFYNSRPF